MSFYDKLIKLCADRGVKPSPVIEACGINKSNLTAWKNGKSKPSQVTKQKLADYFDVPVYYFNDIPNVEFNLRLFANKPEEPSAQEKSLLDVYHSLDEIGKAKLLAYAASLLP